MGGTIRRVFSTVLIALMIMPSAWIAFAEDTPDDNTEGAPVQAEQAQPEAAGSVAERADPVAAEPETASGSGPVAAEPEAVSVSDPVAAEPELTPETPAYEEQPEAQPEEQTVEQPEAEPLETVTRSASPVATNSGSSITIGGTKLDGSSDGSGEGWIYDKENQVIVLKDLNKKTDIKADGTGATIVTTGLCNIGTLKVDGQIDVIGTGVMLIDNLELAEGCDFNLHSIRDQYGEDGGSVAVFLLQEDKTYRLINGGVTGIIDEEITIPEGTTLVLPENSKLNITGLSIGITYDEEGNAEYTYEHYTGDGGWDSSNKPDEVLDYFGKLTVDNLVLDQGSSIIQWGATFVQGLEVVQSIVNNGLISGKLVDIKGDYSGSGLIDDAEITVSKGQEMSIRINDSNLILSGSFVIDKITSSGNSTLCYDEDTVIKNIEVSAGDILGVYSKNGLTGCKKLTLTDTVDGGDVFFGSGIVDIEEQLKLQNGARFLYTYPDGKLTGAALFDYSGSDTVSLGITGPVFMGPEDILPVPDQKEVPVVFLKFDVLGHNNGHEAGTGRDEFTETGPYRAFSPFNAEDMASDGIITYKDVIDYYTDQIDDTCILLYVEVIRYADNKFSVTVLNEENGASVPADNIVLLRILEYSLNEILPGEVLTSTIAARTGSATIGGNANSIITGTGRKTDTSEETKPTDTKLGDVTTNETTPNETGDRPVNAKRKAPVRAQAGNTDSAISFVVDVFDLNADEEDAEEALYYVLSAYSNGAALNELSAPAEVLMDYELPEKFRDKQLYAVFAEEDDASGEMLKAYRAEYDEETGQLSFETAQLGEFVITALDFDGEEYSTEFYDELEKAKEVQPLIRLIKD